MQPHDSPTLPATDGHPAVQAPLSSPPPLPPGHSPDPGHVEQGHTPVHASRGTGGWLLLCTVLFLGGLAVGFFVVKGRKSASEHDLQSSAKTESEAPSVVDVVKVQRAPAMRVVTLPGESRAWYDSTIYARVSGYLKQWNVDIGDSVKEGQVLATIETPELDEQLVSAQAKVGAEKAQVNLSKANVHFAEVTLARFKDAPKGIVSDIERDEKEADYQTSLAKQAAAESDLNSAQSEVDRLNTMISFKKVVAPFEGVITQRHVDIGDLVTAGSTSSTSPLFVIRQTDQIRVLVDVPEAIVPEIHDGDSASAVSEQYPGQEFLGHISRNARAINDTTKTLRVEVDVPNAKGLLLPGMYLKVHFNFHEENPKLVIPASAIAFRVEGPEVAVVARDGKVTFNKVVIARDLGDSIELGSGVSPGDEVALNISGELATGDMVKFNEVQQAEAPVPAVSATDIVAAKVHPSNP